MYTLTTLMGKDVAVITISSRQDLNYTPVIMQLRKYVRTIR